MVVGVGVVVDTIKASNDVVDNGVIVDSVDVVESYVEFVATTVPINRSIWQEWVVLMDFTLTQNKATQKRYK